MASDNNTVVSFKVTPALKLKLQEEALKRGVPPGTIVREALQSHLEPPEPVDAEWYPLEAQKAPADDWRGCQTCLATVEQAKQEQWGSREWLDYARGALNGSKGN